LFYAQYARCMVPWHGTSTGFDADHGQQRRGSVTVLIAGLHADTGAALRLVYGSGGHAQPEFSPQG
jgi:hypothetical protein